MEGRKLKLPKAFSLSSPEFSSLLLDPHSLSLALSHSDSSLSLYPSLSPLSLSSFPHPHPQTQIPSPNSSSTFIHLQNPNSPNPTTLFIAATSGGTAAVLLRFWVLTKPTQFTKATVFCNQKGLEFDELKSGVLFDIPHDDSIRIFGSINVFAIYSISNKKIWVFALRMVDGDKSGKGIKLMRCAVIECSKPVFSISLDLGFLILGEENGVRVFRLKPLVKGRVSKNKKEDKNLNNGKKLPNGVILSNGCLGGKSHKHYDSAKLKSVKIKQDSNDFGAFFVEFENKEKETQEQAIEGLQLAKANLIKALSPDKFLVLDSTGDLHILCVSNTSLSLEFPFIMKKLPNIMKVQKLAVLPDISTKTQYVWISDGSHTVHAISFSSADVSVSENSTKQCEKQQIRENQQIQSSVSQAIFTSEEIQEMVPLATNAVLILGQGSLFTYSIS